MGNNFLKIYNGLTFKPLSSHPQNANDGDVYFNDIDKLLYIFKNGAWTVLGSGGGTVLVSLIDTVHTVKPLTVTTIDGITIENGYLVLFTNLSDSNENNRIYKAIVDQSNNITWQVQYIFNDGKSFPSLGESVRVQYGNINQLTDFIFNGNNWVLLYNYSLLGTPNDGTYSSGLFPFTNRTQLGTAIVNINNILKALSPSPPPPLSSINLTTPTQGVAKISYNTFVNNHVPIPNSNIGDIIPMSASSGWYGVIGPNFINLNGDLAYLISQGEGSPTPSYPAKSLSDGDKGILKLELNDVIIHSVDLSTFSSGTTVNSYGSGFILSAATPISFPNGQPLDLFKYRTGTFIISNTETNINRGYNKIRVIHTVNNNDRITNLIQFVYSIDSTPISASGASISHNLSNIKYLSGVKFFSSGNLFYSVILSNVYQMVYSVSNAITFNISPSIAYANALPTPTPTNYTSTVNIVNHPIYFNNNVRILDNTILSISVSYNHPISAKSANNIGNTSISGILYDNVNTLSTDTMEYFDNENNRLKITTYNNQSDVVNINNQWDSTEVLDNSNNLGLQYYNSKLLYPTINFSSLSPSGNPNYSVLTGTRQVIIRFKNNTGSYRSNFRLYLTGSNTSFIPIGVNPSGNNIQLEMKFPNGVNGTGWMDCYSDFVPGQYSDGNGCRIATYGTGRALNTDWGITLGTQSIAPNEYILLRITASNGWIGYLESLQLTWI